MLYHGAVEYVANTWICVYMIGQLRVRESFFSYFRVEIVGPIFLSFLKKARFFDVVIDFNHAGFV